MKLAIILEGGAVQAVIHNGNVKDINLDIAVIDYDTYGIHNDDLVKIPQSDGSLVNAYGYFVNIEKTIINMTAAFKNIEDHHHG